MNFFKHKKNDDEARSMCVLYKYSNNPLYTCINENKMHNDE